MLFNIPIPVLCVFGLFYGYGIFALITGKVWDRWTGKIVTGAQARLGGITLIGIGVLLTLGAYYPQKTNEVSATLVVWVITMVFVRWMFRPSEPPFERLPLRRTSKRKRKNDELW